MAYGGSATATNDVSGTSITTGAFDVTPTDGSFGYVVISWGDNTSATLVSVTDSTTATWTIIDSQKDAGHGQWMGRAYRENVSGSPTTVTANFSSGGDFRRIVAVWHTGVPNTALDQVPNSSPRAPRAPITPQPVLPHCPGPTSWCWRPHGRCHRVTVAAGTGY
jgi:hypothetical protein